VQVAIQGGAADMSNPPADRDDELQLDEETIADLDLEPVGEGDEVKGRSYPTGTAPHPDL
jgi:hypothetical protein